MKEKNSLDEYFKNGLDGHEIKPSAAAWEKVQASMQSGDEKRAGGWYILRAAVIVLFFGLSTWVFYQNNDLELGTDASESITYEAAQPGADVNETSTDKKKGTDSNPKDKKNQKTTDEPKKTPKRTKAIPIMHSPTKSKSIYVKSDIQALPKIVDEIALASADDNWTPNSSVILDVKDGQPTKAKPFKVRLKVKPATAPAFYAEKEQEEPKQDFKLKLYAYANTQFGNLLQGRPLELPKSEKKPQIEIDLGRIFNN